MSDPPTASASGVAENHRGLRTLALVAVIIGVLALAAAAFLLSYSGIHAIALAAGVTPSLARLYPLILDAMLVIACAAVLFLRGAGLLARCYAWLSLLVLLAAAAGADALNATGTKIPHRVSAAAVAIIPWALVLIGFGLLLIMLQHARQRLTAVQQAPAPQPAGPDEQRARIHDAVPPQAPRYSAAAAPARHPAELAAPALVAVPAAAADPVAVTPAAAIGPAQTASPAEVSPAQAASPAPATPLAEAASPAERGTPAGADTPARPASPAEAVSHPGRSADQGADLAIDTEPGLDDPTSDEAHLAGQPGMAWVVPQAREELHAEAEVRHSGGYPTADLNPAPTTDHVVGAASAEPAADQAEGQYAAEASAADPEPAALAPFIRKRSSPTPPES